MTLDAIKQAIAELPEADKASLAAWLDHQKAEAWDKQLEADFSEGGAGAALLGPCPHQAACPLVGSDWCHFSVRLPRSRDHQLAKRAEVPFEDERFIYLLAARPGVAAAPRQPRVIAPPRTAKPGISLKLCGLDGNVENRIVPKRDKPAYALARRLAWGDTL